MSTRANIIVRDRYGDKLYFYRHSDGYPGTTLESLKVLLKWLKEGRLRDNVSQFSGWLILKGAREYSRVFQYESGTWREKTLEEYFQPTEGSFRWKCGAYEPDVGIQGDIEHLYLIDLEEKRILHWDLNSAELMDLSPDQPGFEEAILKREPTNIVE